MPRRLLYLLLVAALIGLAWFGWRSSAGVRTAQQQATLSEAATGWPLLQARIELERFTLALARHVAGDPAASFDAALERFEIFWSRVPLVDTEIEFATVVDGMSLSDLRARGTSVLGDVDALLAGRSDARGDVALLRDVARLLAPFADQLQEFVLRFHLTRRGLYASTREAIDTLGFRQNLTLVGMVGLACLLLLLAFAETWHARRAEAKALAEAAAARRAEQRFRHFADSASDWLWETDAERRVTFVSERWRMIFGLDERHILGRAWAEVAGDSTDALAWRQHGEDLRAGRPFRGFAFAHRTAARGERMAQLSGVPIHDAAGTLVGYRGVGTDITERLVQERRIEYLARHDAMTGLLNRAMLQEVLGRTLTAAAEHNLAVALLLIDLDGFKEVNDGFGHDVGDRLIAAVGERLSGICRGGEALGRIGGDEFALVIGPKPSVAEEARAAAKRLVAELARPFLLDGQEVAIGASVGVALHPEHATSVEGLLKAADLALYRVKAAGRRGYLVFTTELREELMWRRALERDLAVAVEAGEIELHYQPVIRTADGKTVGFEALARWRHRRHGEIKPAVFVPIAEETGLIRALGRLVLRRACCEAASWTGALARLSVAVNLSPLQFSGEGMSAQVGEALADSGLSPRRLVLEITETTLMRDHPSTREALAALRRLGVRIAIDDFGTGYSSLSYLRLFPVDKLKLDQGFVRDLEGGVRDRKMLAAIIALGRSLGLIVVAEGVETEEQLACLVQAGCDEVQGFLLGPPKPTPALAAAPDGRLAARPRRAVGDAALVPLG